MPGCITDYFFNYEENDLQFLLLQKIYVDVNFYYRKSFQYLFF